MKLLIHHVLDGKTVVTTLANVSSTEAQEAITSLARLRVNDGAYTSNGDLSVAIPARLVEMIEARDE